MLNINQKAPNFTLLDSSGNSVSLNEFKGKKVILYFYPKDNTSGCTKQALAFKENFDAILKKNAVIIGISKDSVRSHLNFSKKYSLPFILLSDPDLEAIKAYDVYKKKVLYGKEYMGIVRTTYIINEESVIIDVEEKVNPESNASDTLCKLN